MKCLNPYYTGSYSMRILLDMAEIKIYKCLNPYYTGSYSMRPITRVHRLYKPSLNPYYTGSYSMRCVSLM